MAALPQPQCVNKAELPKTCRSRCWAVGIEVITGHDVPIFRGLNYASVVMKYCRRATYNALKPRQGGCHFPDHILKCIFLNENAWILLKVILKVPTDNRKVSASKIQQTIIWTNGGLVYWRKYASIGLTELTRTSVGSTIHVYLIIIADQPV